MTVRTHVQALPAALALALFGLALLAGGEALCASWPGLASYRTLTLTWGLAFLLGASALFARTG